MSFYHNDTPILLKNPADLAGFYNVIAFTSEDGIEAVAEKYFRKEDKFAAIELIAKLIPKQSTPRPWMVMTITVEKRPLFLRLGAIVACVATVLAGGYLLSNRSKLSRV